MRWEGQLEISLMVAGGRFVTDPQLPMETSITFRPPRPECGEGDLEGGYDLGRGESPLNHPPFTFAQSTRAKIDIGFKLMV